jgi:hypothetical protein
VEKIVAEFNKRAESKEDMGKRQGWFERMAVEQNWQKVEAVSGVGFRLLGKDYELAQTMLRHYVTGDGEPLVYVPPQPVQDAIAKRFQKPGHYRDVSGFEKWSTPDIRNGLGHFNLDVVPQPDGTRLYVITDRYEFPNKASGRTVEHGFQVGKLSKGVADTANSFLSSFKFTRDTGAPDNKFELRKDPATGEYTFLIPQSLIVDHGTDFESMGIFTAQSAGR